MGIENKLIAGVGDNASGGVLVSELDLDPSDPQQVILKVDDQSFSFSRTALEQAVGKIAAKYREKMVAQRSAQSSDQ